MGQEMQEATGGSHDCSQDADPIPASDPPSLLTVATTPTGCAWLCSPGRTPGMGSRCPAGPCLPAGVVSSGNGRVSVL